MYDTFGFVSRQSVTRLNAYSGGEIHIDPQTSQPTSQKDINVSVVTDMLVD